MFTWHETTRRGLCRLAFMAVVIVPTCAALVAAAWIHSPYALAEHRRLLTEQTALDVTLARVSFPRPQVTLYEGLAVSDPETGQSLARMRWLEIDARGARLLLTCSQPELSAARLDLVWELATRRLRRQAGQKQALELRAGQITLHMAGGMQTLTDVRGRLQALPAENSPQALLAFHLAGHEQEPESQLAVYRTRQASGSATLWQLNTGETVLPGALLASLLPEWDALGTSTSFQGALWWQDRPTGRAAEITGVLDGLELDHFVTQRFPHKFSGTARLELERALVQHGRLTSAKGTLTAGPGLIGRPLLAAAAAQLRTDCNAPANRAGELIAYDQLACAFALDERGLCIVGQCRQAPAGTLIAAHGQRLVKEPPEGHQPALALVRTLAGNTPELAPASAAAQSLVRWLPAPTPSAEASPQARVRLNEKKR